MTGAYNYCSRCGDELSDELSERYAEKHRNGPVLCRACILEIAHGIPKAFASMMEAYGTAVENAVGNAFEQAFTTTEEVDDDE